MILVRKCILLKHKTILLFSPMMIYQHVNERKKEQALNLYFALLIPTLFVFLLRLGYCRAHPIPKNLNKFSSIVTGNLCPFQVFDDVCSRFDVFLALDLAPPGRNRKLQKTTKL